MYNTIFNQDNNQFEAQCSECKEFTSNGEFLEVFGMCRSCDTVNLWKKQFMLDMEAMCARRVA